MKGTHRFSIECEVIVTEEDVYDYLEAEDIEIDKDYELTKEDYEGAARYKFLDGDYTYYDSVLQK